eukprot:UN20430
MQFQKRFLAHLLKNFLSYQLSYNNFKRTGKLDPTTVLYD